MRNCVMRCSRSLFKNNLVLISSQQSYKMINKGLNRCRDVATGRPRWVVTRIYNRAFGFNSEYRSSSSKDFRVEKAPRRTAVQKTETIVVIFLFYGASEQAMKKYCDLYHGFGFDVMYVPSYFKNFARPTKSRELANNILSFLKSSCSSYNRIVIHAFSMGAYNFTVCMREMYSKPESYGEVQENVKAIIYDSIAIGDSQIIASGTARVVSGNEIVRTLIFYAICSYVRLTYPWTLRYYRECTEVFKQKPLHVPTLVFTSENDPMCEYALITQIVNNWRERHAVPFVVFQSWEQSKHCAHLLVHKDDYIPVLSHFLNREPGRITHNNRL